MTRLTNSMNAVIFLTISIISSGYAQFRLPSETEALVDSMIDIYPTIIKKETIGTSIQNRNIFAVKISKDVDIDKQDKPEVLFDAGIHGNEVSCQEMLIMFIRDLCNEYGVDSQITKLVNTNEIWIIPHLNPDGRVNNTRNNARNINLNRDFGYMWMSGNGSSAPFREVETKLYTKWVLARNFSFIWSSHDPTVQIIYSWGYRPDGSYDHALLTRLMEECNTLSGNYYGQGSYENGITYTGLYQVTGGSMDFFLGARGIPSWLVEVYKEKFPADYSLLLPIYQKNRKMMLHIIEKAKQGIGGRIFDAVNSSNSVQASLWITDSSSKFFHPFYNGTTMGDFQRILLPGIYTLTVKATGYVDTTISGIEVFEDSTTQINVAMRPSRHTAVYAHSALTTYMPGLTINKKFTLADSLVVPYALSAPDNRFYSIGYKGYVILDMGQTLYNSSSHKLKIFANDTLSESYTVQVSKSTVFPESSWVASTWKTAGTGAGTTYFSLSSAGIDSFRYVKIIDGGNDSIAMYEKGAGLDLDAVEFFADTGITTAIENTASLSKTEETIFVSPNPWNSRLSITYAIPYKTKVSIELIDINGKRTVISQNITRNPDTYSITYNDITDKRASGVYFLLFKAGNFNKSVPIVRIR